jgi:hypothetical protein
MTVDAAPRGNVLVGILRIARGRPDGIACFGATPRAFLSSLTPLLALPLVSAVLALFSDGPRRALTGFGMALCALLAPAVLSFELARLWKRSDEWLRFATAFNWCEWILPLLVVLTSVPLRLVIGAGLDETIASDIWVACLGSYGLWMQWFLTGRALALPAGRALLFVILVNLGTVIVVVAPVLLGPDF